MRRLPVAILLVGLASLVHLAGCGRKSRGEKNVGAAETPAPAPTPDTTPVEGLRTPAGLVLKLDQAPATPSADAAAPHSPPAQATP